ncbi:unnamed protein product [Anisakis simplex]|uniref:Fibronectin type-III domain-containing protein n=1 Tax=Anisakis simplex TaxID=6269 RepID=A0A0M3KFQ5_ANISI|nr:unnamed protein product [Anisakis simplex]
MLLFKSIRARARASVLTWARARASVLTWARERAAACVRTLRPSLTPMLVSELRVEGVQQNGVTLAWNAPVLEGNGHSNGHFRQPVYEIESRHNGSVAVSETANNYFTFDDLNPVFPYSFKVRALTDLGWGMWSEPLWYQPGRGQFSPMHTVTGGDYITHEGGFMLAFIIMFYFYRSQLGTGRSSSLGMDTGIVRSAGNGCIQFAGLFEEIKRESEAIQRLRRSGTV